MARPFDNQSFDIGELTVESAADRVAFYGQLEVTRDASGLARAQALEAYVHALVEALVQDQKAQVLPVSLENVAVTLSPNPFK